MKKKESRLQFENPPVEKLQERLQTMYETPGDTRDPFFRDYTRILHSNAYRRLKHKTQVFFNIDNDHICTRMEHVGHVEAVSHSIALGLHLNTELTSAIACGHDLGHAPFGHHGEMILNQLMDEYMSDEYKMNQFGEKNKYLFWHEKNGLRFVDFIELLPDPKGVEKNLNLTYAVRDGIISHCGEIDENALKPREECFDLSCFRSPGEYSPCTWEGCVVKIADKIAYLGRDIEDALTLNVISSSNKQKLKKLALEYMEKETLNTSSLMHSMIGDICKNSSPEKGICLGEKNLKLMKEIKDYNYEVIYRSSLLNTYKDYVSLVLKSIFMKLYGAFDGKNSIKRLEILYGNQYPKLVMNFREWLAKYCVDSMVESNDASLLEKIGMVSNEKIYSDLKSKDLYIQAIIDFISGMTDAFAITIFNELISFS